MSCSLRVFVILIGGTVYGAAGCGAIADSGTESAPELTSEFRQRCTPWPSAWGPEVELKLPWRKETLKQVRWSEEEPRLEQEIEYEDKYEDKYEDEEQLDPVSFARHVSSAVRDGINSRCGDTCEAVEYSAQPGGNVFAAGDIVVWRPVQDELLLSVHMALTGRSLSLTLSEGWETRINRFHGDLFEAALSALEPFTELCQAPDAREI